MRFVGGARFRSGRIVVKPSRRVHDMESGVTEYTKPLRAEFRDHVFDSNLAAEANSWTDEEREIVEKALMKHPAKDRADGTGFYLANAATRPISEAEVEVIPGGAMLCLHFDDVPDSAETVQCDLPADPNSPNQLCQKHERQLAGKV